LSRFGRLRGRGLDGRQAARAAGINAPARTLWGREDDFEGGYHRPMHLHRVRIGFDKRHVIVGQSTLSGTVPLAPAFANAIARLTDKPMRRLPFDLA
jgi:CO/xanthine dehydrogenase Mo-binding subunit